MLIMSLAPAKLPIGQRVYAVGDVHGCDRRLGVLHSLIAADLAARPIAEATVVHLGDYVDRGEDSAGVLSRLLRPFPATSAPRLINLMGNHEDMLLAALDRGDRDSVDHWLANGGAETLRSWSISPRAPATEWHTAVPPDQLALLRRLCLFHRQGGYVFVHAGLRPGLPLERQTREDMLWIREPFLRSEAELPGVVVHGHTPVRSPTLRQNRIGIDTGAVMGGVLTCVVLEADRVGFLRA